MSLRVLQINWRLLFLHFLSVPLFILGARQLVLTPYASILELYERDGLNAVTSSTHGISTAEVSGLIGAPLYAWFLAILTSCALSALVVWQRRENKFIPIWLFVFSIVTSWTHYYESKVVLQGVALLRQPLEAWPLATRLAIAGTALLMMGILPFLFTWQRKARQ